MLAFQQHLHQAAGLVPTHRGSSILALAPRDARSRMGACPASGACGSALHAPRDIAQLLPHAQLCLQALSCSIPCSHRHPVPRQCPPAPPGPGLLLLPHPQRFAQAVPASPLPFLKTTEP